MSYQPSIDPTAVFVEKGCARNDPWMYEKREDFVGCMQKRARVTAIWVTVLTLVILGTLAVYFFWKGSMIGGFVSAAILAAIVLFIWLRIVWVGQRSGTYYDMIEPQRNAFIDTAKAENKVPNQAEINRYFQQQKNIERGFALQERYGLNYGYGGSPGTVSINF